MDKHGLDDTNLESEQPTPNVAPRAKSPLRGLSREDKILAVAKQNLKRYGSLEVPAEIRMWAEKRTCPCCLFVGNLASFGTRFDRRSNKTGGQSHCRKCRSKSKAQREAIPKKVFPASPFPRHVRASMTKVERVEYQALLDKVTSRLEKTGTATP